MMLTKDAIGDAALELVGRSGLSSLSMRQVAGLLGVQAGALYWHVESKQELLALLAARILAAPPFSDGAAGAGAAGADAPGGRCARQLAADLRINLLAVRDGAEIVSFAQALRPDSLSPARAFREALEPALAGVSAEWGARTLLHFVLGAVAEQQNRDELARAGIASGPPDAPAEGGPGGGADDGFTFGVEAILRGLATD